MEQDSSVEQTIETVGEALRPFVWDRHVEHGVEIAQMYEAALTDQEIVHMVLLYAALPELAEKAAIYAMLGCAAERIRGRLAELTPA